MARMLLGQILKAMKTIEEAQIQEALQYQQDNEGVKIGQALVSLGYIDEVSLTKALAKQNNMPMVKLKGVTIPQEIIDLVPAEVVEEHHILPVKKKTRSVVVASADPLDLFVLDQLRFQLGMDVECVLAPRDDLVKAIGVRVEGRNVGRGRYRRRGRRRADRPFGAQHHPGGAKAAGVGHPRRAARDDVAHPLPH